MALVDKPGPPGAPPAGRSVAVQLFAGLERAIIDRRRVDELVTRFDYSGALAVPSEEIVGEGQGAVKRLLTTLLEENEVHLLGVDEESSSVLASVVDSNGQPRSLRLHAASTSAPDVQGPRISRLTVHEMPLDAASASKRVRTPLFGSYAVSYGVSDEDGPKWETFDGRVRQRIWQIPDAVAPGNPFIKETMELSTGRLIAIVDSNVWELYGAKMREWAESVDLKLDHVVIEANEGKKNLDTFTFLLDELKRTDPLRRSEPVLCVGGGVLTDTAGFACACWRRGIPWCRMPTTLLGIVDASVGIKVAINYHRKNGVGHFYSPTHTFIDNSFLGTISHAEIRSGVGEIMKAALIHDKRLFELMRDHGARLIADRFQKGPEAATVIKYSIDAMLECIGPDLWEEALLRPMDYGHTFSRTLEADERFKLRHGEAVAVDSLFSALIAEAKGILPTDQAESLLALYEHLGLPCSIAGVTAATYKKARDEITVHRDGLLRAPLPAGIGECAYVDEITDEEIEQAFSRLEGFVCDHPHTVWDTSKSFAA